MERRVETYAVEERIRSSLENLVFALGEMAGADRASLFVVDEERGEPIRVDDADACRRFNPEVDAESGYCTRSLLCVPVRGSAGRSSAVLELLNPVDRSRFTVENEREISAYESELSALLRACRSIA
jgi:GAF domain-containing protein